MLAYAGVEMTIELIRVFYHQLQKIHNQFVEDTRPYVDTVEQESENK